LVLELFEAVSILGNFRFQLAGFEFECAAAVFAVFIFVEEVAALDGFVCGSFRAVFAEKFEVCLIFAESTLQVLNKKREQKICEGICFRAIFAEEFKV